MNKYKSLFVSMLIVNVLMIGVFGVTILAGSSNDWLVKFRAESESRWTEITLDEFRDFYSALVYMNELNSPMILEQDEIDELLENQDNQQKAIDTLINYQVMIDDAKGRRAININDIRQKVRQLAGLMEKQVVMREYLAKVILPQVQLNADDEAEIEEFFNEKVHEAQVDPETLLEYITRQVKSRKAAEMFASKVERLKEARYIKKNRELIERGLF